jgi:hypothetical protein
MKPYISLVFLVFGAIFPLFSQIDYGEKKTYKYEFGLHLAPYLFLEKGGSAFYKSDIKPAETWSGKQTERRVWFAIGHYNRHYKDNLLSNTTEYLDSFYAQTRNWSFVNFGIERVFRKEKSEMWFGSHLGFFYRVNNTAEKTRIKLGTLLYHQYSYYTENQDYGIPVGANFGYSHLLSKRFWLGTEFNPTLEITKRFKKVDKEVPELVTTKTDDFLVAFGKNSLWRLLFLSYKF